MDHFERFDHLSWVKVGGAVTLEEKNHMEKRNQMFISGFLVGFLFPHKNKFQDKFYPPDYRTLKR